MMPNERERSEPEKRGYFNLERIFDWEIEERYHLMFLLIVCSGL